ncbi:acetyl-CoA C-acyltransferase [Flavipsychrobacter stenotrophus]|uniref:acetyl-CoA C-acetyltransferase n=1 Tax=Flavipsychrobacter stenotrophus TaxID=2077091 RepID=A0A2S7SPN3_9BACT|nr:acetyl-CoA C-acyltransferase [Flavipsychrobacter stenotrophus]PQJ08840.1 acetyl-CoA C-acyltransferase [Flavipsychrobacter stenotrophus]
MKEVFIVAAKRLPVGGLLGSLSHLSATELGALAIKGTYDSVGISPGSIDEVYMGNVLSANVGQAPARQAAIFAGIPDSADATTINKVCASGMKATMIGAQQIQLGLSDVVLAGGMESMSNVPHYNFIRKGHKYGDVMLADGMIKDGLWDVYNDFHMGSSAELCARTYNISREAQDEYALASYTKAAKAATEGKFDNEIIPVTVKQKSGDTVVAKDEDVYKVIPDKVAKLKPAFEEGGTVTAANASNLNDSAAALLLVSAEALEKYDLQPLAKIIGFADAACAPELFTTAPAKAIPKALANAKLTLADVDFFEINEAYAAVVLANQQILGIDPAKVNLYGGAVAIGHPLGASGARVICTLVSVLRQEGGKYGVAAICNGGGGASAIVIENMVQPITALL